MTTNSISRRARRGGLAGLVLAVTAIGATLTTAPAAAAAPAAGPGADQDGRDFSISASVSVSVRVPSPPAIPGVPDVGVPGEAVGGRDVPSIDPQGREVSSRASEGTVSTLAYPVTATQVVVNGARLRTRPVTGTVIALGYNGNRFYVDCKARGSDGYLWGLGVLNGRLGWMRSDLWRVVYPGYPVRTIPYC